MEDIINKDRLRFEANSAARDILGRTLTDNEIDELREQIETNKTISRLIIHRVTTFVEKQEPVEDLYPYHVELTMIVAPAQIDDVTLTWRSSVDKEDRKLYVKLEQEIRDSGIFDGAEFDVSRVRNVAGDTIH